MNADTWTRRIVKPLVFLSCLAPVAWLVMGLAGVVGLAGVGGLADVAGASLGANPVETIQDTLGIWGLRLLLLTLVITPLRELLGWPRLLAFRRMLGLFAFFYIAMHFLFYLFVDQALDWRQLLADIAKRPYITVGFTAFLLLVPLALTSTKRAMRRLGRRWQKLHRLVYVTTVLGCIHYWWQVKADVREPLVYAAIAAVLLGWRLHRHLRRRRRAAAEQASAHLARGSRRNDDAGQDQQAARPGSPVEPLAE